MAKAFAETTLQGMKNYDEAVEWGFEGKQSAQANKCQPEAAIR